jgi:heat-inducible transcriptional repressor
MQELESRGYLRQPHISAGRVPTDKAYRYFVNNILDEKERCQDVDQECRKKIDSAINRAGNDPKRINREIADVLREMSDSLVITGIDDGNDFYKTGLSRLFGFPEFHEFDRMFQLTNIFEEFDALFKQAEDEFFDEEDSNNLRVFIGRESPFRDMQNETIMIAKYLLPQRHTGSLTVIGPMRMDYGKNIGLVKYTIHSLNKSIDKNKT